MIIRVLIRPEIPADRDAIWEVNRLAFGGDDEANLVDALRHGGFAEVSLVAEIDGKVAGHIMFSRIKVFWKTGILESLSLAPMAVLPEFQRQRIGSKLVTLGLASYPQVGFSSERARPLESPFGGGEAWMALELVPKALEGVEGTLFFAV